MTDPRESKLPKWAQDIIEQERMGALVRFPDQAEPLPDISENTGHGSAPVGQWIYSQSATGIYAHWVGKRGYLYRNKKEGGVGFQVRGNFYLRKDDALLAHRWTVARQSARNMIEANNALRHINQITD